MKELKKLIEENKKKKEELSTKEEELKYVELFQKDGDIDAKNKLIEHNLRLVVFLSKL